MLPNTARVAEQAPAELLNSLNTFLASYLAAK
jgi:hypothetical protein